MGSASKSWGDKQKQRWQLLDTARARSDGQERSQNPEMEGATSGDNQE